MYIIYILCTVSLYTVFGYLTNNLPNHSNTSPFFYFPRTRLWSSALSVLGKLKTNNEKLKTLHLYERMKAFKGLISQSCERIII